MATAIGALACLQGLGSRVCYPGGAVVGLNGETLQTAQTRSGAPQQGTTLGRYEETGLEALRGL